MDAKTTGIVAYITWIGLVIAFVLGDREGAKFHLNQALVIWLAGLLSFIPCIGWLRGIFCFICAVMGFISAGGTHCQPLLGLGALACLLPGLRRDTGADGPSPGTGGRGSLVPHAGGDHAGPGSDLSVFSNRVAAAGKAGLGPAL